jgi:hypothetical protein
MKNNGKTRYRNGTVHGQWHGDTYCFGLHYDFHAGPTDTDIGTRLKVDELAARLKLVAPDFVQTDCKGHPGMTSWFSQVPEATVSPGVVKDAMAGWRAATRKLGLPLHCHYSGVWDQAAGAKHPDWCVVTADGQAAGAPFGQNAGAPTNEKMCPRGPYLDQLMIPQMIELIDRYGVDGFWVDGDIWAAEPCYCAKCKAAWTAETGLTEPPVKEDDPEWPRWWRFTRDSFYAFVTRYCEAVHRHKPGVLVCSNWLQTFKNPGAPVVPTDWISGDNAHVWGLDDSRREARFLSTRGKPWDIILWNFYCSHGMGKPDSPWTVKPAQMLMQEAAVMLSLGGNVQVYETPPGVRDGRLIEWRMRRLREVSRFIKARRKVCQGTETIPQIAVLHSEHQLYENVRGKNLLWCVDTAAAQGAIFSLLENGYGVDVLDEWALLPRLAEFPLIVAPEQARMSEAMAAALKRYVEEGGNLLLTGSGVFDRFGAEFLGARSVEVQTGKTYAVSAADGEVPLYSAQWRLVEPTTGKGFGLLGRDCLLEDRQLPNPAAVIRRVGKGRVAYFGADLFRDFCHNRYPMIRQLIGSIVERLLPDPEIRVQAPGCIDVALRRRRGEKIIHLMNRASGIPNQPNNGGIDEIPSVGPVSIRMRLSRPPKAVTSAFGKGRLETGIKKFRGGVRLTVEVPSVHIHEAIVIQAAAD